ncbi:MAG: PilZ domain-containing protein [Desulfobulbales bacterium]|nr:PilZ domain-containing protein [Desulfobulbales bacterium]
MSDFTEEKRRAERVAITLPVSVLLLDDWNDVVLAGPVDAVAKNFSPMGLALSLANIKIDNYHLFFTCQDNSSHILRIDLRLPSAPETVVQLPARPIWYDRDKDSSDEKRALLGVEFLLKPKDRAIKRLVKELAAAGLAPPSWWQKKIF